MSKYEYGSAEYRNALSSELLLRRLRTHHGRKVYPVPAVILPNPLVTHYRNQLSVKLGKCVTVFGKVSVAVCHEFTIGRNELLSKGRSQIGAFQRQIAMHLLTNEFRQSEYAVARLFNRDHTCVRLAKRKIPELASKDANLARRLSLVESAIRAAA